MTRIVAPLLAVAMLGGCANDAVLEIHLTIPPRPADREEALYYLLQVRSAEGHPFGAEWQDAEDVEALLLGPEPLVDHFSIVTENVEQDVHVRAAFCGDPSCSERGTSASPQAAFVLRRPFFELETSEWHHEMLALPTAIASPIEIDRCAIRGCVSGDPAGDYCFADGSHPCE